MNLIYFKKTLEKTLPFPDIKSFAQSSYSFLIATNIVRFYYVATLFLSIGIFQNWDASIANQVSISPLWPVGWITLVPFITALYAIRGFFLVSSVLAAFYPEKRWARILTFIGLLEFVSLYASISMADVDWYPWILVAFLFIFLPEGWRQTGEYPLPGREKFLLVFWGAQAITLLTYSMSGLGKIMGAIYQSLHGEINAFAPQAVALHVADRMLVTDSKTVLGPWLIDHYFIAWPFFVGAIYLMLFAVWPAFRLGLQRVWGMGLILYHLGSFLAMGISFFINILLISILFLASPFRTEITIREILLDLPIFGWLIRRWSSRI